MTMWTGHVTGSVWILIVWINLCVLTRTTIANEGYLVVMPKVFRPDVEEVLSVTILKPTQPIYVEAKLFSKTGQLMAESGHQIFGKGTLKVKTPKDAKGVCTMKICGNCLSTREGAFSFYNSSLVTIDEKGVSVFLQTDKPVYKPGQTVHINVFMTGPDLKPANAALTLSLLDPNKTRVAKWSDVHPLCCGLINVSYPLSEEPILGRWTVVAQVQGHTYKQHFDTLKYVLPKFEVTINAPAYIRDWNICQRIEVNARYTFGQDVHGMVKMQASVRGIGYYSEHRSLTTVQRSKIDGSALFNVCISDLIHTRLPDHFRGQLHLVAEVSTTDGSTVKAVDDSCPVNRQLVDLQFSGDTRTTFKPGLPFKGRVLVQYPDGSSADNVTVLVDAVVDGIDFSRESLMTSHGHAQFYIPPLPTIAQSMTISAKVVSIEEERVPETYFAAYLTVNSWYSPSKCHLLIESKSHKYKVGEEGRFMIHSTCPCNLDMYYEVKARGNIVHSGIHFSRHQHKHVNPTMFPVFFHHLQNEGFGTKTCTVFIKFLISHEMAPVSRLLVYYIRPGGEGVADTIVFETEPDFRNKMSIELSDVEAMPGEDIKLRIRTDPGSCVCLGSVDKSVYLLHPDYLLSKDDIFKELETYDSSKTDDPQYHVTFDYHHGHINKRSSPWQPLFRRLPVRDAQYAFEECGLIVMSDTVSLQHREDSQMEEGVYFEGATFDYQIAQLMAEQRQLIHRKRTRVYFPETWMWNCFNTSTTRKDSSVIVRVPDSITTWLFTGVSMSTNRGFSLASSVSLQTFQYFFLDFTLPYSVIRNEQIKIPLVVHNYLHACVRVHLQLHIPSTLSVLHGKETLKKFCIGNEETKTLFYDMIFKELGVQKISATAEAYADSRCCSGILSDESPSKRYLTGMDSVKKQILVEAEGMPRFYTQSVYFCPNSRIQINAPNKYQFQYVARPENMDGFTFNVKARNDARIALSPGPKDPDQMIEIVIGGDFNQQSWIMLADNGDIVSKLPTPGILSEVESRSFWITWRDGQIKVGWGADIGNHTTQFLSHRPDRILNVEYIGFSTGWGAEGTFTIWDRREIDDSGYGEVMYLSLPESAVKGSAFARAKLTGDLMAPNLHNMDKLLKLPRGCGEQNMANFAPNVYILQYLDRTGQLKEDVKNKALELLTKGYQRQLTYQRPDGSYSAFGSRDSTGNTWLSAFVLKTLSLARSYIYVDGDELEKTKSWIMDAQRPDGSFESVGRIINKEIQGGLSGKIALTAFVITAFHSYGINTKTELLSAYSACRYLEKKMHVISEPYTAALMAYALSLLNSDSAYSALKILSQTAIMRDGMTFWRLYHYDTREFHVFGEEPSKAKACSAEIEIAGYAVLSYLTKDDLSSAFPVVKWLMTQRNSFGGFLSTQDTVVALEALSEYATQSFTRTLSMTVSLASTNMDLLEKFHLNSSNSDIIQTVIIPSLPARLFLSASGEGCAMFQVEVQYNVPDPTDHPAFDLWVRLRPHQRPGTRRHMHRPEVRLTLDVCTKWLHPGSSNMAVLEVFIISGYTPDIDTIAKLLENQNLKLKRYEIDRRKVNFYFDEIQSRCVTCLSFEMIRKYKVENSGSAPVRIFDYYEGDYFAETAYNGSFAGGQASNTNETGCSPIVGCKYNFPYAEEETCSCYQDCHENDSQVCASDGSFYRNQCTMEVYACQKDIYLEVMPNEYCEVQDAFNVEPEYVMNFMTTVSWRDFLMSSIKTDDVTSGSLTNASQSFAYHRMEMDYVTIPTTTRASYPGDYTREDDSPARTATDDSHNTVRTDLLAPATAKSTQEVREFESVYHESYTVYPGTMTDGEVVTDSGVRLRSEVTDGYKHGAINATASNFTEDIVYGSFDAFGQTDRDVHEAASRNGELPTEVDHRDEESHNYTIVSDQARNETSDADANVSYSSVHSNGIKNATSEAETKDKERSLKILQPTKMTMWELEPVKAELSNAEHGLSYGSVDDAERFAQRHRDQVDYPGELRQVHKVPKEAPVPEYKLDFADKERPHLSDSDLEDLLSGRNYHNGISREDGNDDESNSNVNKDNYVDDGHIDGQEEGGMDESVEDHNGTERSDDDISEERRFGGGITRSETSFGRHQHDIHETSSKQGASDWPKGALSERAFLEMLALYNSLDSSETEQYSDGERVEAFGSRSDQTEAVSNGTAEALRLLGENATHPAEKNANDSSTDAWVDFREENGTEMDSITASRSLAADVTEPDTGQETRGINTADYDSSRRSDDEPTSPTVDGTSSSKTSPEAAITTPRPEQTSSGTVSPG